MAVYTVRGEVTRDGRLVVALPPGVEPGEASVTIETTAEAAPTSEYPRGDARAALALLRKWEAEGWRGTGRTTEEIDAELNEMRDEWDND